MTKKAMIDLHKEGIIPHIQVHDELDISVKDDKEAKQIVQIMETSVELEVPNKVDYESGTNWGNIKKQTSLFHQRCCTLCQNMLLQECGLRLKQKTGVFQARSFWSPSSAPHRERGHSLFFRALSAMKSPSPSSSCSWSQN